MTTDYAKPQYFDVPARPVATHVTLTVTAVYHSANNGFATVFFLGEPGEFHSNLGARSETLFAVDPEAPV